MDQKLDFPVFPMHFRGLLLLSGMYAVAWGAFFRWFGTPLLGWLADGNEIAAGLPDYYYGTLGLALGVIVFVSSFYPVSWMYLILAGIAGKVILAAWFVLSFIPELDWNKRTIFHLIFNELLWIIPLVIVFIRANQVKTYLANNPDEDLGEN